MVQGPKDGATGERGGEETAADTLDPEDPLVQDAEMYAKDQGISLEEAVRRLRLQDDASLESLQPALIENEQDTFAGSWIQHQPEYRVVVLFTRDGEEKIRPYVEGKSWADNVEVRNGASAILAELEAEQAEAGRILRDLDVASGGSIDVKQNRVEVEVLDRARLDVALREANVRLPEHVTVLEVPGFLEPE